jgi:transcriptional regulator with XRE-family HTH domain
MTVNQRIKILAGSNNSAYARQIGISAQSLWNITNDRVGAGIEIVTKVLEAERDLNARWLLFGDEPMRIQPHGVNIHQVAAGDGNHQHITIGELEALKEALRAKDQLIEVLIAQIAQTKDK